MEKISKEQSIKEIQALVYEHTFENKTTDEVEKDYPQLIKAIIEGKMVLGDKPTFELYKPITDDEGNVSTSIVEFKTRIKPLAMASLTKGIDMSKETYMAVILMNCHLSGLAKGLYDNLSKIDEKVVSQLCSIFVITDYKSLQNAIVTVARSFGWASPKVLNDMYCDRKDHLGIFFWSDDVAEQNKEIKKQTKGKK